MTAAQQVITRKASSRVAEFAFKYAKDNNRCALFLPAAHCNEHRAA